MLEVQRFLTDGGTLTDLHARFAIKSVRHPDYPNLVLLKYNQIDSPFSERIVQECRGIILDEDDGWCVVSRAFDKFFNAGEGHAAYIDWSTARALEKLDGSLCVLYHYDSRWHVATTGTPNAGGDINGTGMIFADLFWRTFKRMGLPLPSDPDLCYAFELTSPYNRVVVQYPEASLTLLTIRNRATGQESQVDGQPYPGVRSFGLQTLVDVERTFREMDPVKQEGYVIVDAAFNRIKVKHPGYVAIHHLKDGFGLRRIVEIVRGCESSEVLSYFPEWRPHFQQVQDIYDQFAGNVEADYDRLKGAQDQKAFALEAVKTKCSAALFALRSGKAATVKEFLATVHIKRLMEWMGVKDVVFEEAA